MPRYILEPDQWDEAAYLERWDFSRLVASPQESPLYRVWYILLSHFKSDPLEAYFLNGMLMCILITVLLFVLLRRLGVGQLASYLSALAALLFPLLVTVSRWPTYFGFVVLLSSLIWATRYRDWTSLFAACGLASFFASVARPEYLSSILVFLALGLFMFFREFKKNDIATKKRGALLLSLGLASLLYWQYFGPKPEESRALYNFREWNLLRLGGFPKTHAEAESRFQALYGDAQDVTHAILNNPGEFMNHIRFAIGKSVNLFAELLSLYRYLFVTAFGLVVLALVFAVLVSRLKSRPADSKDFGRGKAEWRRITVAFGAIVGPLLLGATLYGTTPRHITPALIIFVSFMICLLRWSSVKLVLLLAIGTTLAIWIAPPDLNAQIFLRPYFSQDQYPRWGRGEQMATVLFLREFKFSDPRRVLASRTHIFSYLGDGTLGRDYCWNAYAQCPEDLRETEMPIESLFTYIGGVNMILADQHFHDMVFVRMVESPLKQAFIALLEKPEKFGFKKFPVPCYKEKNAYLYARVGFRTTRDPLEIYKDIESKLECAN